MADGNNNRPVWHADWKRKVYIRLCGADAESVTEWLSRYPGVPFLELADILSDDVAAMQLEKLLMEEALQRGDFRSAAIDSLPRDLRRYLPNGWKEVTRGDFDTVSAFVEWSVRLELVDESLKNVTKKVWWHLENIPPPKGWLPQDSSDPLILAAFDAQWPLGHSI